MDWFDRKTDNIQRMKSQGKEAEDLFFDVMKMLKKPIKKASLKNDKYKHIDFYIGSTGYDVKHRQDVNYVWLEYRNNHGGKGWLRGEAKWIVMYYEQIRSFYFYTRQELLEYSKQNRKTTTQKKHYHWRTRTQFGRNDLVLLVRKKDINHLTQHQITITNV